MRRVTGLPEKRSGRVLVGPKLLRAGYVRIVSEGDGSGRIERFDTVEKKWLVAPDTVSFSAVWSAPAVPLELLKALTDPA